MYRRLFLLALFSSAYLTGSSQDILLRMKTLLKSSDPEKMEQVFMQLKAIADSLPYEEAILYEDELLRDAAALPHYEQAFGWIYELTKNTYNCTHHEDNLVLYHLAIADDPDFDKPAIRQKILYEIGYSYYTIGDTEKTQVIMGKFVDGYQGPITRDLINGLTILGLIAQNKQDCKRAQHYLDIALQKATTIQDEEWIGLASGNMGALYLDMGNIEKGLPFLYSDIVSSIKAGLYESVANDYYDLSNVALKQGDLKRMRLTLDSALFFLNVDNRRYRKAWARVFQNLSAYYKAINRADSAYQYLWWAQHINDSLQNDKNQHLLRLRVNTFNQQKDDRDALLLKASMESNRQNRRLAIMGGVAVLLVSVFAFLYIRYKKKVNRILREKSAQLELARLETEERRKKEEAANQAKDRLFSLIAHDLRGPIGSLKMLLELMQDKNLSREQFDEVIPDVKTRVDNLYNVTDNLLRWAYSQIAGIRANQQVVFVKTVIDSVVNLLSADAFDKKDIRLQVDVPEGLVAWVDGEQLEVVIRNLVSNAIKFSTPGSSVSITGGRIDNRTFLYVKDEGPGLPASVITNLQLGNFSSPATGTGGEKGAGLGLVMCKEFIELNGGILSASPHHPKGTIFKIELPAISND